MASVTVVQGEDRSIVVNVKDGDGNPYDLTGNTAITAEVPAAAGGCVTITKTLLANGQVSLPNSADCGVLNLKFTQVATALFASGTQSIEVTITDAASEDRILQLKSSLKVEEQIC